MKTKRIWEIIAITLICACSQQDLPIYEEYNTASTKETFIDTESLDNIFYHPASDSYIKKQEDPYHIDNIKLAYKNLIERKECLNITEITPTHYALKIYPRNKEELWEIENTEGINVSYIPFNYMYYHVNNNSLTKRALFQETSPYIQMQNAETPYTNTIETIIDTLPILYVAWPCNKVIPDNYHYSVEYCIFNPYYYKTSQKDAISQNDIKKIEQEAINIALKKESSQHRNSNYIDTISGQFSFLDKTLNRATPLHNVKIKFQLGSVSWEIYTSATGYFIIRESIPKEATYNMVFSHPKWKITKENYTTPQIYTYGTIEEKWGTSKHYNATYTLSTRPLFEAHSAVNYYYIGNHLIPKYTVSTGITIEVAKTACSDTNAYYKYNSSGPIKIKVFNNNRDKTGKVISSTLHELGHFAMHMKNGYSSFSNSSKFIKEGWASYIGWYAVREYYHSYNYSTSDYVSSNISSCRQMWECTGQSVYSPILIDLADTYNQYYYSNTFNYDTITSIPHNSIISIGINNLTWESLRSSVKSCIINNNYSSQIAETYLEPYDYWHNQN